MNLYKIILIFIGCLYNVQLQIRYRSTTSERIQTKCLTKNKQFKKSIKQFAEVVQGQYF